MGAWAVTHLFLVALWGGVVLAELVLEALAWARRLELRPVAEAHYFIDLFVEIPLLVAVVTTGVVLALKHPALSPWHWVKFAMAAAALLDNVVCVVWVRRRHHAATDSERDHWHNRIRMTFAGIPLGIAAATLGLWLAH